MTKVASLNLTPDFSGTPATGPTPSTAPVAQPSVEQPAEFRLVIEEDPSGSFIYKTLDRRTGEVVNQFPREQVLRLRETEGYAPGRVFNGQS
jgi:flagellar protein FlaG